MPVNRWNREVNLIGAYHNDSLTLNERAKAVAERIRKSGWVEDTPYPDTFRDLLAEFEKVETTAEWDNVFSEVYDLADEDRVWIETR